MRKVSVVIPYYNRAHTIIRALESVVNQTYSNFEIILINDGSTDNSEKIVNDFFAKHKNVELIHLKQVNSGPSKARNEGIRMARGEYIAFLDSDDSWEHKKLELQIGFMEKNPDCMITGTNYNIITDGKKIIKYNDSSDFIFARFYKMLFKVFLCLPTVVIRKDVFTKDGLLFKEGKHYSEDLLFFLQIVRRYKGARLSAPLCNIYRFEFGDKGGLSTDLSKLLKNDIDNLLILYKENKYNKNKINFFLLLILMAYSYLKHVKRWILTNVIRKGKN